MNESNDLTPTEHAKIFMTGWFTDPNHPLIENKVFYSKSDNLLYYITAHRGPTVDDLEPTNKPKGVTLGDSKGLNDNATDCFNALVKFLDSPAR